MIIFYESYAIMYRCLSDNEIRKIEKKIDLGLEFIKKTEKRLFSGFSIWVIFSFVGRVL